MSKKSENEIHTAYMKGLFDGKNEILNELEMLMDAEMDELQKQKEAQE